MAKKRTLTPGDFQMSEKKEIGLRIKIIRKNLGLTLEEFGKLVGNAQKSNVSKWEAGKSVPSNERLKKIADLAHIPVSDLLLGTQDELFHRIINISTRLAKLEGTLEVSNHELFTQLRNKLFSELPYEPDTISALLSLGHYIIDNNLNFDDYLKVINDINKVSPLNDGLERNKNLTGKNSLTGESIKKLAQILLYEFKKMYPEYSHDNDGLLNYVSDLLTEIKSVNIPEFTKKRDSHINQELTSKINQLLLELVTKLNNLKRDK